MNHTHDRGLVLDPNYDIFNVDAYPDADFLGMYGHGNTDDVACAKSCTGLIITLSKCPVLWISKLKTDTSLSTTEAEKFLLLNAVNICFLLFILTNCLESNFALQSGFHR